MEKPQSKEERYQYIRDTLEQRRLKHPHAIAHRDLEENFLAEIENSKIADASWHTIDNSHSINPEAILVIYCLGFMSDNSWIKIEWFVEQKTFVIEHNSWDGVKSGEGQSVNEAFDNLQLTEEQNMSEKIVVNSRITGEPTEVTLDYTYVTFHDAFHLSTRDGKQPQDFALCLFCYTDNPIEATAPIEVYDWVGKNILARDGEWEESGIPGEWEYHIK